MPREMAAEAMAAARWACALRRAAMWLSYNDSLVTVVATWGASMPSSPVLALPVDCRLRAPLEPTRRKNVAYALCNCTASGCSVQRLLWDPSAERGGA